MASDANTQGWGVRRVLGIPFAPFRAINRWWKENLDLHLTITRTTVIASLGLLGWALYFFIIAQGYNTETGDGTDTRTALSWLALITGGIGLFWGGPEFFFYKQNWDILSGALEIEEVAELRQIRTDVQEAAKNLGPRYEKVFNDHLEATGVTPKKGRRSKTTSKTE